MEEETHTIRSSSGLEYTITGFDESYAMKLVEDFEAGTEQTPSGCSPLHLAAAEGKAGNCRAFLQGPFKHSINGTDDRGETPLFKTIYSRNWETTVFLIENGADVTWKATFGETPLHVAANRGTLDIVRLLISKGSDVHAKSGFGTPLYKAAASGNHGVLEYLLELKADPNPTISWLDLSPIFFATSARSTECLELLLKAGADPNRDSYLSTPLRVAVTICDEEILRLLLNAGADPNILDPVGHKPIEYAAWDGYREKVELLFPVTSPIACYPDWSVSGVMLYAESKEGRALFQSKQKKIYLLAKAKGEESLKSKNYNGAICWYRHADYTAIDARVLSNISLCHTMMCEGAEALEAAQKCIELKPDWAMAHYREGAAWKVLKEFKKAKKAFSKAKAPEPGNKDINKELRAVRAEFEKQLARGPMLVRMAKPDS